MDLIIGCTIVHQEWNENYQFCVFYYKICSVITKLADYWEYNINFVEIISLWSK